MNSNDPDSSLARGAVGAAQATRLPARGILDPRFRYTPSHLTDLRETFARVRRELQPPALAFEGGHPAPAA
ncbi:MAG: hypothetical protein JO090_10150 [Rhizobacter sp.]|nr:hypothetical protein [Rhizobacter sp.]